MHEPRGPERAEDQRDQPEGGLAEPADQQRAQERDDQERVDRALLVGALHVVDRLEGDDGRARHLGVDAPEVRDEALGAVPIPDVDTGVDLQQEAAARRDELAPELAGNVVHPDLARVQVPLEAVERAGKVTVDLILQEGQRRF